MCFLCIKLLNLTQSKQKTEALCFRIKGWKRLKPLSRVSTFMDVFLTRHCNVSAPCPTCIHHVTIQHHDVPITFSNLSWNSPATICMIKKALMPSFTIFHLSFICLSLSAAHNHPASLSPSKRLIFSFSLFHLSHLIRTQTKHKTIWRIKCRLALPPPFSVHPRLPPRTCLLARPEGIVGFRVTGEVGWLNIKLSWELTLLLCPAVNASLFLIPPRPCFCLHPSILLTLEILTRPFTAHYLREGTGALFHLSASFAETKEG